MPSGRPKTANPHLLLREALTAGLTVAPPDALQPTHNLMDFCETMDPLYERAPHIAEVCRHLEAVEHRDLTRIIVTLPPRHSKTYHISERFPAWSMGRNPKQQMILVSYGADLAERNSRRARGLLLDQAWPFPNVKLSRTSHSVANWETEQGGLVSAVGIGGAITGFGADILVIDDYLKNREQAESEAEREAQWTWWQDVAYTRRMPKAAIVIGATRWHEDDLIGRILNSRGAADWTVLTLPALAEADDPLGRPLGAPLWAGRFGLDELPSVAKDEISAWSFASLYQQRPTVAGGLFFTEQSLRDLPADFDEPRADGLALRDRLRLVLYYDLAFSESERADYTVGGLVGYDSQLNVYLLDVVRKHLSPFTVLQEMTEQFKRAPRPPLAVGIERAAYRQAVVDDIARQLRAKLMARVLPIPAVGDKETRAALPREWAEAGKLFVDKRAAWYPTLRDELLGFPGGKYDDQVDMLSGACELIRTLGAPTAPRTSRYHTSRVSYRKGAPRDTASRDLLRDLLGGNVKR